MDYIPVLALIALGCTIIFFGIKSSRLIKIIFLWTAARYLPSYYSGMHLNISLIVSTFSALALDVYLDYWANSSGKRCAVLDYLEDTHLEPHNVCTLLFLDLSLIKVLLQTNLKWMVKWRFLKWLLWFRSWAVTQTGLRSLLMFDCSFSFYFFEEKDWL